MVSVAESLVRLQDLASSPVVARVASAFAEAGYELALVGGPVRDAMLGRTVSDLDFTSNASPDQILAVLKPMASAWWDVGRDFGTIGAKVTVTGDDGVEHADTVEITTYRADAYDGVTRKPVVAFGDTLEDDLRRRDFTVNSMALRIPEITLVDPSGGVEDLVAHLLRTPSSPEVSFGDDPLRMLRAARFASQLGFRPTDDVIEAMEERRETISIVSPERIQAELGKLLATDHPRAGLELLVDTGIADLVLPELPALRLEPDEHHHHKDVYQHSLTVLEQAIGYEHSRHPGEAPDLVLRWAALLHDIGKPATKKTGPGAAVTFYHHDLVGAKLAKKRLTALRYDGDTIKSVARLVELHMRFFGYSEGVWADSAVRRYVRDAGPLLERLHMLVRADVTTRNRRKADRLGFAYDDLEQRIVELQEQEELESVRPDLDGNRIQEVLGIAPGREVGEAYRWLLELRLDEGPLGEEEATRRLLDWWSSR
ncbi:CCA tRNA nucleotidyltransferase [Plantibacter sp. VKM Ac-2876]|uniref:CCA tRNA nucleotidyltransferase n=1 Tax=Plantibacter sp. VKM Ac-2876 TaxID=2783826 RepID=UPI00188C80FB|nr:CCA tRNA nucleotidyltransferase [Plantibacter sp. VKM Ac-2876]MBF4564585.1 CCA tRNA nucleotidyltransferase [Plantibacter sp. VKM Ac-2876]